MVYDIIVIRDHVRVSSHMVGQKLESRQKPVLNQVGTRENLLKAEPCDLIILH